MNTIKWDDFEREAQTNEDNIVRFKEMMADVGLEIAMYATIDEDCSVTVKEIKTGKSFKFTGNID